MLQRVLEPVLSGIARDPTAAGEEPRAWERGLVLALYGGALFLCLRIALAPSGALPAVDFGDLFVAVLVLAGLSLASLAYGVRLRRAPLAQWFLSHCAWLASTFAAALLAVTLGSAAFAVGLLFAVFVPPLALLLVHGPVLGGTLLLVWFGQRALRGAIALLRVRPIGGAVSG